MIAFYEKLTGDTLTPEQRGQVVSLKGYWQLWEDNGEPRLSQFEPCSIEMKKCSTWHELPENSEGMPTSHVYPPKQDYSPNEPKKEILSPEQKLIKWLQDNVGWHPPYEIKKHVRPYKDEWSKESFVQLLDRLADEGVILRLEGKYASTGTLPS